MIISIFASIWSQNLWDELILKNEIKILENKYSSIFNISKKDIEFNIFTYDIKNVFYYSNNVRYVEYFPINIKKIKNIFRNIKNLFNFIKIIKKSDLIIIWGWWIIYDNELQSVWNPLKQLLFRTKIFKIFRKKVDFFRIWINIKNDKNLVLIKKIFSWANNISVRDNYSFNLLKKLGFKNLELLKDPVFYDKENNLNVQKIINKKHLISDLKIKDLNVQNIKKIIENKNINLEWKKIWIALRRQKSEKYLENIVQIIKYFLDKKVKIIFIPHSFHKTDNLANDFLFFEEILNSPVIPFNKGDEDKIKICKTMKESYEIYKQKKIDLNLASRLHSIILSQVYEIDFIWVSYSKKTDEVLKMMK